MTEPIVVDVPAKPASSPAAPPRPVSVPAVVAGLIADAAAAAPKFDSPPKPPAPKPAAEKVVEPSKPAEEAPAKPQAAEAKSQAADATTVSKLLARFTKKQLTIGASAVFSLIAGIGAVRLMVPSKDADAPKADKSAAAWVAAEQPARATPVSHPAPAEQPKASELPALPKPKIERDVPGTPPQANLDIPLGPAAIPVAPVSGGPSFAPVPLAPAAPDKSAVPPPAPVFPGTPPAFPPPTVDVSPLPAPSGVTPAAGFVTLPIPSAPASPPPVLPAVPSPGGPAVPLPSPGVGVPAVPTGPALPAVPPGAPAIPTSPAAPAVTPLPPPTAPGVGPSMPATPPPPSGDLIPHAPMFPAGPATPPVVTPATPPTAPTLPALPAAPPTVTPSAPPSAPALPMLPSAPPSATPPAPPNVSPFGPPVTPSAPPSVAPLVPGTPGVFLPGDVQPRADTPKPPPPIGFDPPTPATPTAFTKPVGASDAKPAVATGTPKTDFDVDLYDPKQNDSYESISQEAYNDKRYAAALRQFNRNQPLQGGRLVELPPIFVLKRRYPNMVGGTAGGSNTLPAAAQPNWAPAGGSELVPVAAPGKRGVFVVPPGPGMTLQAIAREKFGTEQEWRNLYDLNRHVSKPTEVLSPGTEVKLMPDGR